VRFDEGSSRRMPEPGAEPPTASGFASWHARLSLSFAQRRGGTQLIASSHEGPLRVQRPFHPEGRVGPCHVYVLHPPGGIVSGDRLRLDARLAEGASALLTAPGASKLYRARAARTHVAAQAVASQHFRLGPGATLEWLPHETIVFDGARAAVRTEVDLAADATYVGWELLCLGRPAAGERFGEGALRTELLIRREGRVRYLERGLFRGGDVLLEAPWGLRGQPVLGTFVVAAPQVEASWVEAVRDALGEADAQLSVTLVSGLLVARYLGGSTREARALFEHAHSMLRPLYAGRAAVRPRIWST